MAMAETSDPPHVRHSRRRPFSTWMKRLTNLKSSSSSDSQSGSRSSGKRSNNVKNGKRQNGGAINNPYPLSGAIRDVVSPRSYNDTVSYTESTDAGQHHQRASQQSLQPSTSEQNIPGNSAKSTAPTLSTNGDTARSEAGYSKAGTTVTGHGGVYGGGEGSTFSSPAPSVRSLTTTLTTVQSAAPSAHVYGVAQNNQNANVPTSAAQNNLNQQNQFSHQFPPSPASAVPPHLAGHPTTYSSATANNILTDNASILTLASSSKRRRRNSLDTNASVRALAPSSMFGGSRESLPLSVLSANVGADASNASITNASGVLSRQSLGGLASAERISVYSAPGTVPLVPGGDRSSLIASKQGDNGSVRSGTHSHTRNDSAAGSVTGTIGSTLNNNTSAGPNATITSGAMPGRISRRSSGWGEISGEGEGEEQGEGEGTHQQGQDGPAAEKAEELNQEHNSLANGDPGPSVDEEKQ
ncbi:hypothetical protein TMatcc_003756 [Talaromyces marneffei ATCC 18224]|uniref:Ca2+-modulated nonselective cation channel polycystin n=2 Tax=Talaromyces marneffei TaxID=37727 RepID=B6Q258_TALMQ|nr:uncharacterized protein EYB26_001236 [Talaromyces marneffei]EEA27940.1 conserved hypothetical protein [Talaromyces marneffei ATCC 18224]KAE8556395.1 hypothetical protein EYB25_001096 [Talaromyces marneffei]QGA13586.1 hypothetical protein EYB26_001236 [Talaromyces marneffei]